MESIPIKMKDEPDILYFQFVELDNKKHYKLMKDNIEEKFGEMRSLSEGNFLGKCREFARLGNEFDIKWYPKIDCLPIAKVTVGLQSPWYYILVWVNGHLSIGEYAHYISDIHTDWVTKLKENGSQYYCTSVRKF